jgi:alpha-D-ribose 1-methylphosphonate 5-triphosphate synthase subunit PhnH
MMGDPVMRDPGRGFADPIFDSQATYRKLQDTLARPGLIQSLDRDGFAAVEGLPLAAAATLLTLADYTTPVWLAGGSDHPAASWLAFHSGAKATAAPLEATFAFLSAGATEPLLQDFAAGDACYPDRSATVLVECRDFFNGPRIRLRGPGIRTSVDISPSGLRPGFWQEVESNAARFPLGVDILLIVGAEILGLPRTTHITLLETL